MNLATGDSLIIKESSTGTTLLAVGAVVVAVVGEVTNILPCTCSLLSGSVVPMPIFWALRVTAVASKKKKKQIFFIINFL